MSNTKKFFKRSSKGAAVFMSATMILLAVAGDLALPVGVYANENDPGEISLNEGEHQIEIIVDNPEDGELEEVAPYQIMDTNNGYIGDVNGTVNNNNGSIYDVNGTVTTNNDSIEYVSGLGTVDNNKGSIKNAAGEVTNNNNSIENVAGYVKNNNGSIDYLNGSVTNNNGSIEFIDDGGQVSKNNGVIDKMIGGPSTTVNNNNENATIKENYASVYRNENGATIGTATKEDGIRGNYGNVQYNFGTVIYNGYLEGAHDETPVIKYNYGTVKYNNLGGEISLNEHDGLVETNGDIGIYDFNNAKAVIDSNHGTVNNNIVSGVVNTNYGTIVNNKQGASINKNIEDSIVKSNSGNIRESYGEIGENTSAGTVNYNYGKIKDNKGRVESNANDHSRAKGDIESNSGRVLINHRGAVIEANAASGLIDKNEGTVNGNKGRINNNRGTVENNEGTVVTNAEGGVVLNCEGGIVETNDGEVYNYGGTVGDNNGTEYFSVDLVHNDFVTISATNADEGLSDSYGKQWIGETDGQARTVTLLITPARNYKIDDITGLDENYVTADKQRDGSWVLTISSGANLTITIPDPTEAEVQIAPVNNPAGGLEPVPLNPVIITDPEPEPDPEPDPIPDTTPTPNQIQLSDSDPIEAMLTNATWNGSIIVLSGGTSVSLDNLSVVDCSVIQTDLLENTEMAQVYESAFLIAIECGASVKDARSMAFDTARVMADYFEKDLPTNYTPEQAAMYKKAYIKAFVRTLSEGKALKKARNVARSAGNNVIAQGLLRQLQEDIANTEKSAYYYRNVETQ